LVNTQYPSLFTTTRNVYRRRGAIITLRSRIIRKNPPGERRDLQALIERLARATANHRAESTKA
jgi:hypothetical protein